MQKKIESATTLWQAHEKRFACPHCCAPVTVQGHSLRCVNGHRYDLSRQGGLNILEKPHPSTLYTQALFEARARVLGHGLFSPIVRAAAQLVKTHLPAMGNHLWLDAGCGEGTVTFELMDHIGGHALACDISAPAMKLCAGLLGGKALLLTADLAHLPLQDDACALLVNFLTPANYKEFTRILAPEGLLLKIVPGPMHLHPLRVEPADENGATALFKKHCTLISHIPLTYTMTLPEECLPDLYAMNPLTAGKRLPMDKAALTLCVDVSLLFGRPHKSCDTL